MPADASGVVVSFVCALILGLGIGVGGMLDPTAAQRLFSSPVLLLGDRITPAQVDFTLMVVFMSGLVANFVLYYLIMNTRRKPIFGSSFSIPTNTVIDLKLVLGSFLFGLGWALGGYCPGPGVISVANGDITPITFTLFMFGGMSVYKRHVRKQSASKENAVFLISLAIVGVAYYSLREVPVWAQNASFSPVYPQLSQLQQQIIGGSMIGIAASSMMLLEGKILGISGILSGLVDPSGSERFQRLAFLGGLIFSGELLFQYYPQAISHVLTRPLWCFAAGGLLVGIGTGMANGCTSGHGICGNTRLSKRSFAATLVFMLSNFVATSIVVSLAIF